MVFLHSMGYGSAVNISYSLFEMASWEMDAKEIRLGSMICEIAQIALPIFSILGFLFSKETHAHPFYAAAGFTVGAMIGQSVSMVLYFLWSWVLKTPGASLSGGLGFVIRPI